MFATIVGPYPRPDGLDDEAALRLAIEDQLLADMGVLADGAAAPDPDAVAAWRRADAMARSLATELGVEPRPLKARLPGPWTSSATLEAEGRHDRESAIAAAQTGNLALKALFVAGAPLVQVEEDGLTAIAADDAPAQALAIEVFQVLLSGVEGHVSLSIVGGDPCGAGPEVLYSAPFSSHVFDLILGPDGWRLARQAPRERGLILGVADARVDRRDPVPVSVWAARYGASMGARGLDRIGLAPSAGLEERSLEVARMKLRRLAEAAAVASLEGDALRRALPKRARSRGRPPGTEAPSRAPWHDTGTETPSPAPGHDTGTEASSPAPGPDTGTVA